MMKRIHLKTIFVTALVVLLLSPVAQPQVAAGPAPAVASLSWYAVRGPVFTPNSSTMVWSNVGGNYCMGSSTAGVWRASLNIPDGSIIKALVFGYYNGSAADTASSAYIYRLLDAGGASTLFNVTSSPGSTHLGFHSVGTSITSDVYVVDNSAYSYFFHWSGSTTQDLCYMKVGYVAPSIFGVALPVIQNGP